jgi:hypothetical protein
VKVGIQPVLAFLLLAVLPQSVIVFFSYSISRRAFRQAVAAEPTVLGEEMGDVVDLVDWSGDGSPAADRTFLVLRTTEEA